VLPVPPVFFRHSKLTKWKFKCNRNPAGTCPQALWLPPAAKSKGTIRTAPPGGTHMSGLLPLHLPWDFLRFNRPVSGRWPSGGVPKENKSIIVR